MRLFKCIILFQFFQPLGGLVYGQLVLDYPESWGTYTAPQTITLSPGFHSKGSFRAFIAPAAPVLGNAASSNQNYVQVTRYLRGYNTPPSLSVADAMRDITYYDGLGRPSQQVSVKAATRSNGSNTVYSDLAVPIVYDAYGRQERDYLPYATTAGVGGAYKTGALTQQASYYNSPPTGAGVVQIPASGSVTPSFGRKVFEPSPLNRVQEQGFPGASWQPASSRGVSGRTVSVVYNVNNTTAFATVASTRRVARYGVTVNYSTGVRTLTLASNAAYAAGELHVKVTKDENWTDADGRNGTVEEYTDKLGRMVLSRTFESNQLLSTYFVYDEFGNLCFVLSPGGTDFNPDTGTLPSTAQLNNYAYQYRYDDRNRLVEKKLPGNGWEYVVYNQNGKVVATQDANQRAKSPQQWTVTKYDALGRTVLTGLYNYGATANQNYRIALRDSAYAGAQFEVSRTTGIGYSFAAWPRSSPAVVLSVDYYDDYEIPSLPSTYKPTGYSPMTHGKSTARLVKVLGEGTGTNNMLWSVFHYDNNGYAVRQYNQHFLGGEAVTVGDYDEITNEYSFTGQVTKSTRRHYSGGTSASLRATIMTEYDFDHRDRVTNTWKTLNTGSRTLVSRKTYNEVGQLVKKELHSGNSGGSFADSVKYAYNERGWLRHGESPKFKQYLKYQDGPVPQYNGNISRQEWRHGVGAVQHYNYSYDKIDRLVSGVSNSGKDEKSITYDRLGNIKTLQRDASPLRTYDYGTAGSRLQNITGGLNTYQYDGNGNMTRDGRLDRTIGYNHLNLPVSVSGTPAITFTYDAMGRKLRSVTGTAVTDYIDGIEWEGGTLNLIQMEEGRILPTGIYEYVHQDHLGNTRSGFASDAPTTSKFQTDYYPFGLSHVGGTTSSPKNRYLYNGKELQEGLGYYDYGARYYDPFVGRWTSVDPLAESYYSHSSYNYALNDPIGKFDPNGMATFGVGVRVGLYEDENDIAEILSAIKATQEDPPVKGYLNKVWGNISAFGSGDFWYGEDGYNYKVVDDKFYRVEFDRYTLVDELPPMGELRDITGFLPLSRVAQGTKGIFLAGAAAEANVLVYLSFNAKQLVQYVGITNNFAIRAAAHLTSKGIDIVKIRGLGDLTRTQARAVEQVLIEYYGLGGKAGQSGQLLNRINSISSSREIYKNSLKEGLELLQQAGFKF